MTRFTINRRRLLMSGLTAGLMTAPGLSASLAQVPGSDGRKLVLVILRGAMDGLAALAPISDPFYADLRGRLALTQGTPISDGFILHPALSHLAQAWSRGELLALHATATPYRARSHFDGQDLLETGATDVGDLRDGWLNRTLQVMGADAPGAVAVGASLPLILRGDNPASTWSPPLLPEVDTSTLERLTNLYMDDPVLGPALAQAIETDLIVGDAGDDRQRGRTRPADLAAAAAQLMTAQGGPDLAVLEVEGWDTHVNQGAETGTLANRFTELDAALESLRLGLGAHWNDTVTLVVTEFGRTVRVNGGGGTDHGTGSVAFAMGGAVHGGRILGDWPGLHTLYEDRDLMPVNDLRGLLKGVLNTHWGIGHSALDQIIFPDSASVRPFSGIRL